MKPKAAFVCGATLSRLGNGVNEVRLFRKTKVYNVNMSAVLDNVDGEIPGIYQSIVTVSIKARLRIGNDGLVPTCLAATNQGNLLIFSKGKLFGIVSLPFKNSTKVRIYRSHHKPMNREFAIISSSDEAAVIDIRNVEVIKQWENIESIDVKDMLMTGEPQVIIYFKGSKSPAVVSEHSQWEHFSDVKNESETTPLDDVIQALVVQLRNAQANLVDIDQQTKMRRSMLNRSRAALRDAIIPQSAVFNPLKPTFLIPMTALPENLSNTSLSHREPVKIASTPLWQLVIDQNWLIGTIFTNNYSSLLRNIDCVFTCSGEKNCQYEIYYFVLEAEQSMAVGRHVSDCLPSTLKFDGQLQSNQSLAVVVKTVIPEFNETDAVAGNIFLASQMEVNNEQKTLQTSLGCISFSFQQLRARDLELKLSNSDLATARRHLLSLSSFLIVEEEFAVTTVVSSAIDTFRKMTDEICLVPLSPLPCYYGHGIFGHVIVSFRPVDQRHLTLKIRARSHRQLNWLLRCFKTALPDDMTFAPAAKTPVLNLTEQLEQRLSSAFSLLTNCSEDSDVEVMETNASPSTNPTTLDLVRSEFLRKQSALLNPVVPGVIKIPAQLYNEWQITRHALCNN